MRNALKANPRDPRAIYLLSQLAIKGGALQQAISFLKQHIALVGEQKEVLLQLAQLLAEQELNTEASQTYERLIQLFPDWAAGLFSYAGFLQTSGQLDKVIPLLNKVLRLEPEHCGAYLALSNLITFDELTPLVKSMEQLLAKLAKQQQTLPQMQLNYALGKAYDDLGLYHEAFECWKKANQIQLNTCQFRVAQMKPFFEQLMVSFESIQDKSSKLLEENNCFSVTPVFIVGLPRSGSTLLEQMLSQHTDFASIGEANTVASVIASGIQTLTKQTFPGGLEQITDQQWQLLGKDYLKRLQEKCPNSPFVINKLPANFQSIGIIKKAMPQAIIIHMTRTPQAVALSVFRNYFSASEPYFCDLQEFNEYRNIYLKLMMFWKNYFCDQIVELSYEQLVNDSESVLRDIFKQCGVEWQSSCLDFFNANNSVKTLSDTQVRKPLYRSSLEAWRHYHQYL